jgi:GDP-L-fucose synthase
MTFGSIAGHRGLVGSALLRDLQKHGYRNIIVRTHTELELRDGENVREFFATNRPDAVVVPAARVGGIKARVARATSFAFQGF